MLSQTHLAGVFAAAQLAIAVQIEDPHELTDVLAQTNHVHEAVFDAYNWEQFPGECLDAQANRFATWLYTKNKEDISEWNCMKLCEELKGECVAIQYSSVDD